MHLVDHRWTRLAIISLVCVVQACGPSLRRTHQANVYFERCAAADRDPTQRAAARRACWTAWLAHHAAGQPVERVNSARERLVQLAPETSEPMALAGVDPEGAPGPGEGGTDPVVAPPAPAEGAELSGVVRAPQTTAPRRVVLPSTRTSGCTAHCAPSYERCVTPCALGDRACRDACRHRFWSCSRACY